MPLTCGAPSAQAASTQDKARAAAGEIVFGQDASQFTVVRVRDDGFLEITLQPTRRTTSIAS